MIHRNADVVNAVVVFAVLGVVAIVINIYIIRRGIKNTEDTVPLTYTMGVVLLTFVFEDCIDLFLEYFWIEEYITSTPPYYLVAKDTIIAFIALFLICDFIKDLWEEYDDDSKFKYLLPFQLIACVAAFLRSGAVIYQYFVGKINHGCLAVVAGQLMQKPFARGCMRKIDYTILVMNFVPLLTVPIFAVLLNLNIK